MRVKPASIQMRRQDKLNLRLADGRRVTLESRDDYFTIHMEESDGVSTLLARGLPDRPAGKPVRSFSNHNVATADGATNEEADSDDTLSASPEKLDKGRWHIMRVPGADHSLGTWASDKTDDMFRELLALLDAQT